MTGRYVLGIDPGKSGAWAFIDTATARLWVSDVPRVSSKPSADIDWMQIARDLDSRSVSIRKAFLEKAFTRPQANAGGTGMLMNWGRLRGMLDANFVPTDVVDAKAWKRAIGLPTSGKHTANKNLAREFAAKLMPACASLFARAKDDGRAEAALIALYGCRQLGIDLATIQPGAVA